MKGATDSLTLHQGDWRPPGGKRVAQIVNVDKWSGVVIVILTLGLQVAMFDSMFLMAVAIAVFATVW